MVATGKGEDLSKTKGGAWGDLDKVLGCTCGIAFYGTRFLNPQHAPPQSPLI